MREIVLDTETTGLDPADGHRIVEIGAVELLNHMPTGRTFHVYLNPDRDMPPEAFAVHGLSIDFLHDKPRFADVVTDFMTFVAGARLVIHNAAFDMKFLNWELRNVGKPVLPDAQALDTVMIARQKFPGSPASLDALCRRFGVDNSGREKHGALLDSELLAEVYLELIGGRQPGLSLVAESRSEPTRAIGDTNQHRPRAARPNPLPPRLTAEEEAAHAAMVEKLGAAAVWRRRGLS
jgi:DNA polymerase III subunit epsilon